MKSLVAAIVQFLYRLRHGITLSNSPFEAKVDAVNALADETAALSDSQLRERFKTQRRQVMLATSLDDVAVTGQLSTDLTIWDPAQVTWLSSVNHGDGTKTLTWRATAQSTAPRQFIRAKAQLVP